jgi:hypothetical protein
MRSTPAAAQLVALAAGLAAPEVLAAPAAVAAVAGCYAPRIEPGSACSIACPGDLACVDGACEKVARDPSLIAHWRFDDPAEDGVLDSSGRGHHGTCSACPELVPAVHGGGYRFTAARRQIIVVPDAPDFRGVYTITAWIRPTPTAEQKALMSKPFGDGIGNSWQLEVLGDDRVSLSGGSPHSLASPDPIAPGEWHHLAGSWDGHEKELFIDGDKVAEVDATLEYDGHAIYLGGDQNGGEEVLHWDGVLDDLRVYDRELSNSEIGDLADGEF